MTKEDLGALSILHKKYLEYTKDGYRKARGRTFICDNQIKHVLDYMHKDDEDYLGVTCRFLQDTDTERMIGFQLYEMYKIKEPMEEYPEGYIKYPYHKVSFSADYKTDKVGKYFVIVPRKKIDKNNSVQEFVDIL